MPAGDETKSRVLLVRRGYLGDILLLSRVCTALRRFWPDVHIAIACQRAYASAVELLPDANEAIELPESWTQWPGIWRRVRRGRFTHVMDYDNRARTAVLTALTGATLRVAFPIGRAKQIGKFAYHRRLEILGELWDAQHMSENYLWAWREIGVALEDAPFRLAVPAKALESARRKLAVSSWSRAEKRNRLIVHVGTRSEHRRWPAEKFAAVAQALVRAEPELRVAFVGGPGDEAMLAKVGVLFPEATMLGAIGDVRVLAGLLDEASDFLGHDSGPAHLAAGLGLRIVTLATAPQLAQWRPLGDRVVVLSAPSPCPQCLAPGVCAPPDTYRMKCVGHVGVDAVVAAVGSLRGMESR
jgi:heptosyltransferase III